ncbi:MAG TPA: hypothetical protein VNA16_08580, partial [Abditibacteriaceae bacterium]|nr:hypothetical protein [Abditibacteriaceae bacterium]
MAQLSGKLLLFAAVIWLIVGVPCRADVAAQNTPRPGTSAKDSRAIFAQSTRILNEALTLQPPRIFVADVGNPFADAYAAAKLEAAHELLRDKSQPAIDFLTRLMSPARSRHPAQSATLIELFQYAPSAAKKLVSSWLAADKLDFEYHSVVAALWQADPVRAHEEFARAVAAGRWELVHGFADVTKQARSDQLAVLLPTMLRHKDNRIRLLAALQLAERGNAAGLPVLRACVRGERTDDIEMFGDQRLVVAALGRLWAKGGRAVLMAMLKDTRFFGMGNTFSDVAAYEILERAAPRDLPLVRALMQKEDLRYWAFRELPRLEPRHAAALLRKAMRDEKEDINIRAWSAFRLARTGDEAAIRFLEDSCYQRLGIGGTPARYLLQARNIKARAAYLNVLNTAAKPGEAKRAEATASILSAFDDDLTLEDIFPVWPELLRAGTKARDFRDDPRIPFWSKVERYPGSLGKVLPILRQGLD